MNPSLVHSWLIDDEFTRPDWTKNESRPKNLMWLDKNENCDPLYQDFLKQLLLEIDHNSLFTYPNAFPVYSKLAKYCDVNINQMILTPGSDGVIRYVFQAFIKPGDVVIHTSPTFAMYPVYCKMFGAKAVQVEYEKTNSLPKLDLNRLLTLIFDLQPKLVCLPVPDSPTGSIIKSDSMVELLNLAQKTGSIVLIDEAYFEFYKMTCVDLIHKYENLVIARTFSKGWGLAGLRAGYAISNHNIIASFHKLRPMYEINTIAIAYLDKILDYSTDMQASVERLLEGKKYFRDQMEACGFKTLPNFGNFQHVAFADQANKVHEALSSIVLYRKNFNEDCLKGYSRFSITTVDRFTVICDVIKKC